MPIEEEILGFNNRWYKDAIKHPTPHQIAEDLLIKSVTAPYLLATKIEAFNSRGNCDFLGSHDFEDFITIIAGRTEIVEEINQATPILKNYFYDFLSNIMANDKFDTALPGHLNDGPVTDQRVRMVKSCIKKIIVLTHVPPFKESCLHNGKISDDDWLPCFSSKIIGDVLMEIAQNNSAIDFLVLCGHTHSSANYNSLYLT